MRAVASLALLVAIVVIVDPRGDFPLIDDWGYALPIEHWLARGELRFTGWQSMTLATQLLWGALFSAPFGFSFTALRLSTLVAAGGALLGQYWLARELGSEREGAQWAALTLLANPVFLLLSHTFMTDVPFLALTLASAALLVRALATGDALPWVAGLVLAVAAVLLRQVGLALPMAFCAGVALRFGLGRALWLGAVLPLGIAALILVGYEGAIESAGLQSKLYPLRSEALFSALSDLARGNLGALRHPLERSGALILYGGLFSAPAAAWLGVRLLSAVERPERVRLIGATGTVAVAGTVLLAALGAELPRFGNLIVDFGLGVRTLAGPVSEDAPRALWLALTAIALASAFTLGGLLLREAVERLTGAALPEIRRALAAPVFLVALVAIYFGPLALAYGPSFDRYFLLPATVGVALATSSTTGLPRPSGRARAPALLVLALWLGFSVAGTHDYLDWNRERYAAAEWLERFGKPASAIDAGFEFGSWRTTRAALARGTQGGRVDRPDAPFAVVFEASPGDAVLHVRATHPWLPWAPSRILAIERALSDPGSDMRPDRTDGTDREASGLRDPGRRDTESAGIRR